MRKIRLAIVLTAFLVSLVQADEWEPGTTRAVIVGVLEWNNSLGGFSKLHHKDQGLHDLLVKRGMPENNITLLLDQDAPLPKIHAALDETIKQAGQHSTLITYIDYDSSWDEWVGNDRIRLRKPAEAPRSTE